MIFLVALLWSLHVLSQEKQEEGLIIFEGEQKVFDLYFIKTSTRNIISLLNSKDTITAIYLDPPGDNGHDQNGFKEYLDESIKFDTLSTAIKQNNHLGQEYELRSTLLSKFGQIGFNNKGRYKVKKRYKKLYIGNKIVVIALEDVVRVSSFDAKA
ncbi:MAG TPA: hypothetical protein VK369_15745 [Segetibacter sp.]|nr:hypothetical protein [Segetibacter sp.]